MSLFERPTPEAARNAFRAGIQGGNETVGPDYPNAPEFHHPVYAVGLRALDGGAAFSPKQVGWQFLTRDSDGRAIGGDVPQTSLDGGALTTSRMQGPAVDKALQAILTTQELDQVRRNDYEVRVLRIPGLRIEAFWLKAKPYQDRPVSDDFVFPYLSFAEEIPERQLLPMSKFVA